MNGETTVGSPSRRQFLAATASAGALLLAGCQARATGDPDPVAIIARNESSETHHLSVRVLDPDGDPVDTYVYALPPGTTVDGMHAIRGAVGSIHASVHTQTSYGSLPDASVEYDPGMECEQGRPDVVITVRDDGIGFSYAC